MQRGETTRIDAIASRDLARGREVAAQLGIPKVYGSYEELLADPDIDAIYNPAAEPSPCPLDDQGAWRPASTSSARSRSRLTAEEARQLEARERAPAGYVVEAFMVRHHPQWQRAREIARSGRIGEVRAIQTFFSYFLDRP